MYDLPTIDPEDWPTLADDLAGIEDRATTRRYLRGFGPWVPAANIKVRGYLPDIIRDGRGVKDWGEPAFCDWAQSLYDDDPERLYGWHELACEDGFQDARELGGELFGPGVKFWQDGRSGGWLYAEGLPDLGEWGDPDTAMCEAPADHGGWAGEDVCGWPKDDHHGAKKCPGYTAPDAEALRRRWLWFEAQCEDIAQGTLAGALWLLWANEWEHDQDRRAKLRERFGHLPGLPVAGVPL